MGSILQQGNIGSGVLILCQVAFGKFPEVYQSTQLVA